MFTELQSHYLFTDRFGVGKGNDKGRDWWDMCRRNFLVCPIVRELLRSQPEESLPEQDGSLGERMSKISRRYDASDKRMTRVSSLSLVRGLLCARGTDTGKFW